MDIKTCRMCGKIFQSRGSPQCPDCVKALDQKFVEVRNYIFENPQTTMMEICEVNDVTEDTVLRWMHEGRLILSSDMNLGLHCHSCGKSIVGNSGTLCAECGTRLRAKVDAAAAEMQRTIEKDAERFGIHTEGLRRNNS